MSYRPKHWIIQELVSKRVYDARRDEAWELLDPRLLMVLDRLVDRFGPAYCNNWHQGGMYDLRGLRHLLDKAKCDKEGIWLNFGQHERGAAADINFYKASVKEVREYIIAHPDEFPEIKGIEIADGWLHIDVRNSMTVEIFKA